MADYKEIQKTIRERFNFVAKSCWIAHVLDMSGKRMRRAPNRISDSARVYPCPNDHRRAAIIAVLQELGVLGPVPVTVG